MSKKKTHIINCGTRTKADLAYMAMFRYAFGRMTYMPTTITEIIKNNADNLSLEILNLLDRELTEEADRYARGWKDKSPTNYGGECDRRQWMAFHDWVKAVIAMRKEEAK